MSDPTPYDPIPEDVREAYETFVALAEAAGLAVVTVSLHTDKILEVGDDLDIPSVGHITRYWPRVAWRGLGVIGRSPSPSEETVAAER